MKIQPSNTLERQPFLTKANDEKHCGEICYINFIIISTPSEFHFIEILVDCSWVDDEKHHTSLPPMPEKGEVTGIKIGRALDLVISLSDCNIIRITIIIKVIKLNFV